MLGKIRNLLFEKPARHDEMFSKFRYQDNYTYKSELVFDGQLNRMDFVKYVDKLIPSDFRKKYELGSIHQLGLVANDVEEVIPELEAAGFSPFLVAETCPQFWYECGRSRNVRVKSATGFHHGFEIEPLGPVEGSDIYKQSIDPFGRLILHHVAFSVHKVDDWALRFNEEGFPLVLRGRIAVGPLHIDFAYMDTSEELGLLVEFCSYSIFGLTFKPFSSAFTLMGGLQKKNIEISA